MDEITNARKIKRFDAIDRVKIYGDLLEILLTDIPEGINHLFSLSKNSDSDRELIKKMYNTGYMIYLKCWKIQNEYAEFFPQSPLSELDEAKRKLDLTYRDTMRKLRLKGAQNVR